MFTILLETLSEDPNALFMANRISNEALLKVAEKVGDNLATLPPPGKGNIMSGLWSKAGGAPFHQGRDSKERQSDNAAK